MCWESWRQEEAGGPGAEWVLVNGRGAWGRGRGCRRRGQGQSCRPQAGEAEGPMLGPWEVTGGCVAAKDRTHSQACTWKLVNMERYKHVCQGLAEPSGRDWREREPSEPGQPPSSCLSAKVSLLSPSEPHTPAPALSSPSEPALSFRGSKFREREADWPTAGHWPTSTARGPPIL